jgi:hypothetical protein
MQDLAGVPAVPALTIAIPTYNRAGPLARQLAGLQEACRAGLIEVLVIDDGSSDETPALAARFGGRGFRLLRNHENIGYGLNFCRLFTECCTPYLLVTADDDEVDAAALPPLIAWLERRRPDFASTQWLTWEGALYRGRPGEGPIAPRDFRKASGHAPGLVYAVAPSRLLLGRVESLVKAGDPLATLYPQVVLVAKLMREGRSLWYPAAVVKEGSGLPSQLVDASGRQFGDPAARIEQLIALDRILTGLRPGATPAARRRVNEMIRQNAGAFYWTVRESFRTGGSAECARRLDASALRYLLTRLVPRKRLRNPRAVSRAPVTGGA